MDPQFVHRLAEAARRVVRGDRAAIALQAAAGDDVRVVAGAFNALIAHIAELEKRLAAHQAELDAQVHARTAELSTANSRLENALRAHRELELKLREAKEAAEGPGTRRVRWQRTRTPWKPVRREQTEAATRCGTAWWSAAAPRG